MTGLASDRVRPKDIVFERHEVPFYTFADYTPQATLRMAYASHEIETPDNWLMLAGITFLMRLISFLPNTLRIFGGGDTIIIYC
jgi:hypothetical protein